MNQAAKCLALLCALGVTAGCGSIYRRPVDITPAPAPGFSPSEKGELRDVVLVGNNWSGTVTVFDPVSYTTLAKIDVVPDWDVQIAEIKKSVVRQAAFKLIRQAAGEKHHQLVDDVFMSKDGRYMYASRPSLADVIAIDVTTGKPKWTTRVEGVRADHAALSPDGTRLLVSASTAEKVHVIDTSDGRIVTSFESGNEPHESNYSHDESKIYHASIGRVFLPPLLPPGKRVFQERDAKTYALLRSFDLEHIKKAKGCEWRDTAVRPMALAPDGRFVYLQMSFYHGLFELDLEKNEITRCQELFVPEAVRKLPDRKYQLRSAHHGITMSGDAKEICVAGTMSAYAAIVNREDLSKFTVIPVGEKPYWSTTSADGTKCYVSVSEKDRVAIISFADKKEVGTVATGDHPQRVRTGRMLIATLPSNKPQ